MKMQKSTLPKFEISIFKELGFEKSEKSIHENQNFKFGFPKNEKSGPQNLKFDFDFEF